MTKVKPAKKASPAAKHNGKSLASGAQKILNVAAALSLQKNSSTVSRDDIATVAAAQYKITGKSTVANACTVLKNAGLILLRPKEIEVTVQGLEQADTSALSIKVPKNTQEYLDIMKEMHKLKPKVCDLLDQLVDGEPHSKEEVAEAIGSKINSTFAGLLTACKKANIITFDSKTIKLLPEMLKYA